MESIIIADFSNFTFGVEVTYVEPGFATRNERIDRGFDPGMLVAMAKSINTNKIVLKGAKDFTVKIKESLLSNYEQLEITLVN